MDPDGSASYHRLPTMESPPDQSHESILKTLLPVEEPITLGVPARTKEYSWKENLAAVACFFSFGTAISVVFVQRWAVYWQVTGQLIWIGLSLTLMSWCAQVFLRRFLLVAAIQFRSSSTLQSLVAIIQTNPLASKAHWSSRAALIWMLAIGPILSALYKKLSDGHSSFAGGSQLVDIGLTGPPGIQRIGYGLSLFVNATLPWFEQPGLDRAYGFNTYVVDENTTAILDAPMPTNVLAIQSSLHVQRWTRLTGVVSALVCTLNPDLEYNRTELTALYDQGGGSIESGDAHQQWVWNGYWNKGMLLPNAVNNTDIYFSAFNSTANQTFGDNARRYTLTRQNYTAAWLITASTAELVTASPVLPTQILDEQGVFTGTFVSLPELFMPAIAEFDTLWRQQGAENTPAQLAAYAANVTTDATTIVSAVWARFTALLGPETWAAATQATSTRLSAEQGESLLYSRLVATDTGAATIVRGWQIIVILSVYPLLMMAAFFCRVLLWPRSPVGEGFGVVSLIASVDGESQRLLRGAGLSGKLKRPLALALEVEETVPAALREMDKRKTRGQERRNITAKFENAFWTSGVRLRKGVSYW